MSQFEIRRSVARISSPAYLRCVRFEAHHQNFVALAGCAVLGAIVLAIGRPHYWPISVGLFGAGAAQIAFTIVHYRNGGRDAEGS